MNELEDQWSCECSPEIWYVRLCLAKVLDLARMAQLFLGKSSFHFNMQMTFGQGQEITLTLNAHISNLTQ